MNATNIAISGPGNTAIPAGISYNISAAVATITPTSPLPSGTITVTEKSVADAAGVAMTSVYGWEFETTRSQGSAVAYV